MNRFQSAESGTRSGQDIELSYPFFPELGDAPAHAGAEIAPREDRVLRTGLEPFVGAPPSVPFQLFASELSLIHI